VIVDDLPVPGADGVDPILRRGVNIEKGKKKKKRSQAYRSLICFAMVRKTCSTFVEFFAEVSRKGIESWSANSYDDNRN
jgi:hypothetical protein